MIKRSELSKGMYVRMSNVLDDDSYWSRLMKGRYFEVDNPAKEPDDSSWWSMTFGTIVMYGMNYMKQASNSDMDAISTEEQEKIRYILAHKNEYQDLFKTGRKIERLLGNIEDALDEIGVYRFDLWDVSGVEHFMSSVQEEFYSSNEDEDISDYESELEELKDMFTEVETLLDKLTTLEDKYIRGI